MAWLTSFTLNRFVDWGDLQICGLAHIILHWKARESSHLHSADLQICKEICVCLYSCGDYTIFCYILYMSAFGYISMSYSEIQLMVKDILVKTQQIVCWGLERDSLIDLQIWILSPTVKFLESWLPILCVQVTKQNWFILRLIRSQFC